MLATAFHESLDNVAETGRFFVALAERLEDGAPLTEHLKEGNLKEGKGAELSATRLAHTLLVPRPPELKDASVEMLPDTHRMLRAPDGTTVVVTYPPVPTPEPETPERAFKKCFKVCQDVKGAKVCAEVCVDIKVGMDGVHGSISATVTVAF